MALSEFIRQSAFSGKQISPYERLKLRTTLRLNYKSHPASRLVALSNSIGAFNPRQLARERSRRAKISAKEFTPRLFIQASPK